jgi:hypothetical protein
MRFLYFLLFLLLGAACKPVPTISDFPEHYEQVDIEWSTSASFIFQEKKVVPITNKEEAYKAELLPHLAKQPAFQIQSIHLFDANQALVHVADQKVLDTLYYEQTAADLLLWWPDRPDEMLYFQKNEAGDHLYRPFIFYWKMDNGQRRSPPYFRLQEMGGLEFEHIINQHLVYDSFLIKGDTVQLIEGLIAYKKK